MLATLSSKADHVSTMVSVKNIPANERLILALDVEGTDKAKDLVEQLGNSVNFYKLGLELFMSGNYFELIEWLKKKDKKIFVDLKFFDIPETVRSAVRQLRHRGATFVSVHGTEKILEAAVSQKNGLKILAVTVLTAFDNGDLRDLGFECDVETLVLSRARRALEIGCDGVISSGMEAGPLRKNFGEKFIIVSPGIRPVQNDVVKKDDQKRVMTPSQAIHAGADYVVVGRPIRDAANPRAAAEAIQAEIAEACSIS